MMINNPNKQGGSNILTSLLQMLGGKQGAGIGSLMNLFNTFKEPSQEDYQRMIEGSDDFLRPKERDEWSHLPPGAL